MKRRFPTGLWRRKEEREEGREGGFGYLEHGGEKEGGKEEWREGGREGGTEGGREGRREGGREGRRGSHPSNGPMK